MTDAEKKCVLETYIAEINKQFVSGNATEYSYRGALERLLTALLSGFTVTNEPSRIECGAPDYIITKGRGNASVPIAFIETKNVNDSDLDGLTQHKAQFDRYKQSLEHIVFTDYLDFHLYESGTLIDVVRVAEIRNGVVAPLSSNFEKFYNIVTSLTDAEPQKITNAKKLADLMAAKAKLLATAIYGVLDSDSDKKTTLYGQWSAFRRYLIHTLSKKDFADIYAQTIAYGMFAARIHDQNPKTFSRAEAATLIPESNPFLRKIFQDIAGYNIDKNIVWIVDDLAEAFRSTDMEKVLKTFNQRDGFKDPLIHFYEEFLTVYDSKTRLECGVFYTPLPVVKFIVNAIDEILQSFWNLPMGLADPSKIKVRLSNEEITDNRTRNKKQYIDREFHKIQILDPATGTGTFLAEIVNHIWEKMEGNQGAWQNYVEKHLLPRLNGFELMMAPYAVAHLKLDMTLSQTGYNSHDNNRLKVFLTNSLEAYDKDAETLWAQWLAQEANEANLIKRDSPVMIMVGNPPYNKSSKNKGDWIIDLMKTYKENLIEQNLQTLSNDYIKFIRLGQYYVEKNGEGILAYITSNGFLNGMTFKQMRKSLMKTFDKVYILNLHGYSEENDCIPEGVEDENVFDITQGVSINIFIKKGNLKEQSLADVYYHEIFGNRSEKFDYLNTCAWSKVLWDKLNPHEPNYFFVPKNFSNSDEYGKGFKINELMNVNSSGIQSGRNDLFIDFDAESLKKRIQTLLTGFDSEFADKFNVKDSSSYPLLKRISNAKFSDSNVKEISILPFDERYIYYDEKLIKRSFYKVQRHFLKDDEENVGLALSKQCVDNWKFVFCTNRISDMNILASAGKLGAGNVFPLYLIPSEDDVNIGEKRKANLNESIWKKIDKCVGASDDKIQNGLDSAHITTPEEVFDYIYGCLHIPSYRARFNEFLKIDFPRIPYPQNREFFYKIVDIGSKLRKLHLMQDVSMPVAATFPAGGNCKVVEVRFESKNIEKQDGLSCDLGKVFINDTQYFDNVSEIAWNFYVGGYQPAQKWLKERKGRVLEYEDIEHYKKIVAVLLETYKLMQKLDSLN